MILLAPLRRRLVSRALLPLKAVDPALHRGGIDYVVTGADSHVLMDVASSGAGPQECLGPAGTGFSAHDSWCLRLRRAGVPMKNPEYLYSRKEGIMGLRDRLYRSNTLTIDQWVRLGRLLEAVDRAGASRSDSGPDRVPAWLCMLISDVLRSARIQLDERSAMPRDPLAGVRPGWDLPRMIALLSEDGVGEEDLPAAVFLTAFTGVDDVSGYGWRPFDPLPVVLPGTLDYLVEHAADLPARLLGDLSPRGRTGVVVCARASEPWAAAGAHLVGALAVDASGQLRRDAIEVLKAQGAPVRLRALPPVLAEAPASRTTELMELLSVAEDGDEILVRAAEIGRRPTEPVRRALSRRDILAGEETPIEMPSFTPIETGIPAAPARAELRSALNRLEKRARERGESRARIVDADLDALLAVAEGRSRRIPRNLRRLDSWWTYGVIDVISSAPSLAPVHVVRITTAWGDPYSAAEYCAKHGIDPRALSDLAVRLDLDESEMARSMGNAFFNFGDPRVSWPWFAERPELLRALLGNSSQAPRALEILGAMPCIPAELLGAVAARAVGSSEMSRPPARAALRSHPRVRELAEQGLTERRAEARASAAAWVGSLGERTSVPALEAALRKERKAVVRAALLLAMRECGGDAGEFLSPGALGAEAAEGLKRRTPASLARFDLDALPEVHWKDGAGVDPRIIRWWVVLVNGLNEPDGRGIIGLYLSLLEPSDADALADHVVRAWAAPTRPGPATAKGLLAFAVRMDGAGLVELVRSCMRAGPRLRVRLDALLHVLHAHGSPEALQVLLDAAQRHTMASIRGTAAALVRRTAEERGWSPEELADRTIPTAGFDDDGLLHLSYGDRGFTGRLRPGGTIELADDSGRARMSLPAARVGEDAAVVKEAKRRLTAARKEVKAVLGLQTERLHEAMCTGRTWSVSEWCEVLAAHPIMGRLVTRLIWAAVPPGGAAPPDRAGGEMTDGDPIGGTGEAGGSPGTLIFRPVEDGALIGVDDAAVDLADLAPGSVVRLAHRIRLGDEEAVAWREHLADYEVTPLFDQLSATAPRIEEGQRELRDLEGRVTGTLALQSAVARRGYKRGDIGDKGVFDTYVKDFASAALTAVLGFTGTRVPEGDRTCAITSLSFTHEGRPVPLTEVPPVLLAECGADYAALADLGPYDPDWRKNVKAW